MSEATVTNPEEEVVGVFGYRSNHKPEISWEERQRRRIAAEKRQETVARNRAIREGQIKLDDHSARFAPTVDGHGRRAVCHCGSDGEVCPDDDTREDINAFGAVSSDRVIGALIGGHTID